ncbi:reductive dehalogenase [Dehalococcoides sp. THU3]|uniref:reductive dehalogenase n=1 Tax=Dehalococcoides TaxID=61434 RepID=UPI003218BCD9
MSSFHSILTRRDFMKGLGLGTAGVSAATVAVPLFHDLDEMMASEGSDSTNFEEKLPWYVKRREYGNPTVEVDWNALQRWHGKYNNDSAHLTPAHYKQRVAQQFVDRKNNILANRAGFTLRDYGLNYTGFAWPTHTVGSTNTPESLGVPKWEGTPEQNARMLRAVARWAGGSMCEFFELDEKYQKLIPMIDGDARKPIIFEDVPQEYINSKNEWVWPIKFKYGMVCMIPRELELMRRSPSGFARSSVGKGYDQGFILDYRIQTFLRNIGYDAVAFSSQSVPFSVMSGIGELVRMNVASPPAYGPMTSIGHVYFTDLPLPASRPVDAGMLRFCKQCIKCAEICPAESSFSKEMGEPAWDITATNNPAGKPDNLKPELFNNFGKRIWPFNQFACKSYWMTLGCASCTACSGSCVFSKERLSSIHELVKPILATTPVMNNFFYKMDSLFSYGRLPMCEWDNWWDEDKAYRAPVMGYR